ncbi:MAG TPA: hypothetical protein VK610_04225 [Rhodothermales bacterium]|nr:hypothetical protein [Rhodothermales bacterium]
MPTTPTPIGFGALDLVRGPGALPHPALARGGAVGVGGEGALAACENLRPTGTAPESPGAYTPVRLPKRVPALEAFRPEPGWKGPALAVHYQVRERTVSPTQSQSTGGLLRRWIVMTAEKLWAVSPVDTGNGTTAHALYTFDPEDDGRTATFAPMGAELLVATRRGTGEPGPTLLVGDTGAVPLGKVPYGDLRLVDPPVVPTTGPDRVFYRCALRFPDGSLGPAGPLRLYAGEADDDGAVPVRVTAGLTLYDPPGAAGLTVGYPWRPTTGAAEGRAKGVALFAGVALQGVTNEEGLGAPLRLVREFTWDQIAALGTGAALEVTGGGSADDVSGELLDTDPSMLAHGVRATVAAAYNRRLVLGAVAYDLAPPPVAPTAGANARSYTVHVRLRLAQGDVWVRSEGAGCAISDAEDWPGGLLSYPDRRAVEAEVYRQVGGSGLKLLGRYGMVAPAGQNVAYVPPPENGSPFQLAEANTGPGGNEPPVTSRPLHPSDYDPNRVLMSAPLAPLDVRASSALYVGDGPDDAVTAILALAEPLSEGQYGDYPLVVACRASAWSLATGEGVAVAGVAPIWTDRGVGHPRAVALGLGAGWGACPDGLQQIRPGAPSISRPVETAQVLKALAGGAPVGYLAGSGGGELWVAVAATEDADAFVLCLHLDTGRWYTRPLARAAFARVDGAAAAGTLVGIDAAGRVWAEDALETAVGETTVPVRLTTAALDAGLGGAGRLRVRHGLLDVRGHLDGAARLIDAPTGTVLGRRGTADAPAPLEGGFGVGGGARAAIRLDVEAEAVPGAVLAGVTLDAEARRLGRTRYDRETVRAAPPEPARPAPPAAWTPPPYVPTFVLDEDDEALMVESGDGLELDS